MIVKEDDVEEEGTEDDEDELIEPPTKVTRTGRTSRRPARFGD
jgi:hypothetical protein